MLRFLRRWRSREQGDTDPNPGDGPQYPVDWRDLEEEQHPSVPDEDD